MSAVAAFVHSLINAVLSAEDQPPLVVPEELELPLSDGVVFLSVPVDVEGVVLLASVFGVESFLQAVNASKKAPYTKIFFIMGGLIVKDESTYLGFNSSGIFKVTVKNAFKKLYSFCFIH